VKGVGGKLLSPLRRRHCVEYLRGKFGISEERVCRVVGQPRSTQRYAGPVRDDEELLQAEIVACQPIWSLWISAHHGAIAKRWLGCEPQACGAPLAAGEAGADWRGHVEDMTGESLAEKFTPYRDGFWKRQGVLTARA
jgi:hypothetical protein